MKKQTLAGTVFENKVVSSLAKLKSIISVLEILQKYLETDYGNEMVVKANFMLNNIIPPLKKLLKQQDKWVRQKSFNLTPPD